MQTSGYVLIAALLLMFGMAGGCGDDGATSLDTLQPADVAGGDTGQVDSLAPEDLADTGAGLPDSTETPTDTDTPPTDSATPPADTTPPPADTVTPPPDTDTPPVDTGSAPDTAVDTVVDTSPDTVMDTVMDDDTTQPPPSVGTLAVDCSVPFILDGSKMGTDGGQPDMVYWTMHFGDLVQQFGITGTVKGVDITAFPEKMYYGTHMPGLPIVSLTQVSMQAGLTAAYTVRIDFEPDSAITAGATWPVGLEEGQAFAILIKHVTQTELCLLAIGSSGSLTFSAAQNVTQQEGGSFAVSGSLSLSDPAELEDMCDTFADAGLPCCQ